MRNVSQTVTFYPVTSVYLAGVFVAYGLTAEWFGLGAGVISLTLIAILATLVSTAREVQLVHLLVEEQKEKLVEQICDLTEVVHEAGLNAPGEREKDKEDAEGTQTERGDL